MSDTHPCPAGCGQAVAHHQFACARDWYRLPKTIRDAIWRGYRTGNIHAHARAMELGRRWYQEHAA